MRSSAQVCRDDSRPAIAQWDPCTLAVPDSNRDSYVPAFIKYAAVPLSTADQSVLKKLYRERERGAEGGERERQTDRQTDRQRQQTDRDRDRQTDRQTGRQAQRDRDKEKGGGGGGGEIRDHIHRA